MRGGIHKRRSNQHSNRKKNLNTCRYTYSYNIKNSIHLHIYMYFNLTPKKMNVIQPSRLLGAASGTLHCNLKPQSRTCSRAPSFFSEPQLGMKKCCPRVATSHDTSHNSSHNSTRALLRLFPGEQNRSGALVRLYGNYPPKYPAVS